MANKTFAYLSNNITKVGGNEADSIVDSLLPHHSWNRENTFQQCQEYDSRLIQTLKPRDLQRFEIGEILLRTLVPFLRLGYAAHPLLPLDLCAAKERERRDRTSTPRSIWWSVATAAADYRFGAKEEIGRAHV